MADVLKGNFTTKKSVEADVGEGKSLEDQFEKEALKRLGGSIAFVKKRQVMWQSEEVDSADETEK